ncbi:MAG: SIMPL domain-containing protein [Chloroflexota bacterium]|nr:SIMPL domain-containing protein [Chloroflexota bacterium]
MADPGEHAIVVNGESTVRRVPDLAVVSLGVMARDRRPAVARDEANRRATAILARLGDLGVPDADVQAPSLTVQPTYDYSRSEAKLTGYQASRPMTIRVRDIDLLGPILDGLVDDGATQIHGTSMELADAEAASREALAAAVTVARARAEALARAAGVSLGGPIRIEEEAGDMSVVPMAMMRTAVESIPTEIAAGEIEINARVRVWFAIG